MSGPAGPSGRAVVCSSEPGILRLLCTVLADAGLDVRARQQWSDLAGFAAGVRPDVVILDLAIGREGACWAALRELRAQDETRETPVVICAAADWMVEEYDGLFHRPNVYTWGRPFDLRELVSTVLQAAGKRIAGASTAAAAL